MKKQVHFFRNSLLTLALSLVSLGMFADELKPYPVYFSFGDYPEFKTAGWRNPASNNTSISFSDMKSITWTGDATISSANLEAIAADKHSNCGTLSYRCNVDNIQSYPAMATYGDYFSLACSYNRAMKINFTLPWLNPGKYRVYMNMFSTQTGGNAYRGCAFSTTLFDQDTTTIDVPDWIINSSGMRTIGGNSKGAGIALGSFNGGYDSVFINPIISGVEGYTNTSFYCGQVVVAEAGIHTFSVVINGKDGVELGFDMISLVPVTTTDVKDDYEFPKFDVGGNIYLDTDYPYANYSGGNNVHQVTVITTDSTSTINVDSTKIIDKIGVSMGVLPFQVNDPSTYSNMKTVTMNAGRFFSGKSIVLLRAADKWTRMFTGVVNNDGIATASVPAGEYYCEVDNTDYAGKITIDADKTIEVGTETAEIEFSFNADDWYIDNSFRIYSADGTKLYKDVKIGADGKVGYIELPIGKYYYRVGESADKTAYFDEGTISVTSTEKLIFNLVETTYDVNIAAGTDASVINQDFKIYRASNDSAVYVDAKLSATGTFSIKLPAGSYVFKTDNFFLRSSFEVKDAAVTLDYSGRFKMEAYFGKILNGYILDAYKYYDENFRDTTLRVGHVVIAEGKATIQGLSMGDYRFSISEAIDDTTIKVINPFTSFTIDNEDVVIGDPNTERPYIVPKAVFFDPLSQPEINWRTDAGKTFTNEGNGEDGLEFVEVPVMPVYSYKIDTVWTTDSTYELKADSTNQITTYRSGLQYVWTGTATEAKSAYVNGDYAAITMISTNCPNGVSLSFTTPIILPGRYNIYLSNRFNNSKRKPMLDTIFVDGKPTSLQDVTMCFYTPQDAGETGSLNAHTTPYRRSVSMSSSSSFGNILDTYLGWIDIETYGRHTLTLKSMRAGCYYVDTIPHATLYTEKVSDKEYRIFSDAVDPFWVDLFKFIPVGEDAAAQGGEYYPLFDICGYPSYLSTSTGNNDLGTEGVNHIFAPWQQPEMSVFKNDNADYTSKLTLNSGVYGAGDKISLCSTKDNWTHVEYQADTLTGNIISAPVIPGQYTWQTLNEGIVGKGVLDLGEKATIKDVTLTIPETLNSVTTGSYSFIPSEDDPEVGTVEITVNVGVAGEHPFFYPVQGEVVFYEFDGLIKSDTMYAASKGSIKYQMTDYALGDLATDENQFYASYGGNGGRLQASSDLTPLVSVNQMKSAEGIMVYPSYVTESVNIVLGENANKAKYQIFNQAGQLMNAGSFSGTSAQVDFNNAASGMYFMQVNVNGKQATYKLVVK